MSGVSRELRAARMRRQGCMARPAAAPEASYPLEVQGAQVAGDIDHFAD